MAELLRALIVEDSEDDAILLSRELTRGGYDVFSERVDTGAALSAALDRGGWDIILADYTMPHFRGTVALEMVRSRGFDTPFIFVSGTIGEDVAVEALKAGANDYVIKGNLKRLVPAVARERREAALRGERNRIEAERVAAEEALRQSEEKHRLLFEHIGDTILLFDGNERIRFASSSVQEVLGYSPGELTDRPALELVHSDDVERVDRCLSDVMSRPGSLANLEMRVQHRDGSWRIMDCVLRSLVDRPEIGGIVLTSRDVTERKRLEAEFLQAQKLESVGRLAGGVAHDFNNLLTVVLGYADELLADPALSQAHSADIEEIKLAAQRATTLTRQLLAFSRRQVMDLRPLDLNAVVLNMEILLRRTIGENIKLRSVLESELGTVTADVGQVEQVLLNLIVNARDAMPSGGRLTIESKNVAIDRISSSAEQEVTPGTYVMLAVSDSGQGMNAETRARIFDPFFTTKKLGEGTGLGLATVYGIVTHCGGHISVTSEVGQGSRFEIYLPRVEAVAEDLPVATTTHRLLAGTETVVLVEDETAVRELVIRVLRAQGYTVLAADRAEDALPWLTDLHQHIDLVITDVVLPGMGGKAFAEAVWVARPGMPVLFVSGYAHPTLARQGILEPGTVLLEKPFAPAALACKVRGMIDASTPSVTDSA